MKDDALQDLLPRVEALVGRPVDVAERLPGGANNRVYRVELRGGPLIVKVYHQSDLDRRDRLGAEFALLQHLWSGALRCIPEPLAADPEAGFGVYGFVEGKLVAPGDVRSDDTMALAGLLGAMWQLREAPGAHALPEASEATFCAADLLAAVEGRLARLRSACESLPAETEALRRFLEESFEPVLASQRAAAQARPGAAVLPRSERTLSPSDHGYHNALRRPDGSLVFLDFEYGGWDDPAKMLADACLQPRVPIPEALRGPFVADAVARIGGGKELGRRLGRLYPLWALKWCLILLNEFVPSELARRRFAGANPPLRRDIQLEKARQMLKASLDQNFLSEAGVL